MVTFANGFRGLRMKPWRRTQFFTLALLALFMIAGSAFAQTRIMPLGNSITEGVGSTDGSGYRLPLYNLLTNASVTFDFVGGLQHGNVLPDKDHEGHAGFKADDLQVANYLSANPADVILLEIGTNDISSNESATQVRDDIEAILDAIFAQNPSARTYLSTTIPRRDNKQPVTASLNALLPALVSSKVASGQDVVLVDIAASILADPNWQTTLMDDDKHPNDAGYEIMAQEWFNAIQGGNGTNDFFDDFNSGVLSASWSTHPGFQVQSNQLVNTSTTDAWNNHLAVPNVIVNPNVLEFKYGSLSDAVARDFTSAAVMLDNASTTASGYMVFRNGANVRLWTLLSGVPGQEIMSVAGQRPAPQAGDVFRVELASDAGGHHFTAYINGQFDATLTDINKLQGNTGTQYAGLLVHGNTNDGVDDVHIARASDTTPPAAITDLSTVSSTSASVTLSWTAPGDDGNNGTARSYDLRYSTSSINSGNFNAATNVPGIGAPNVAGALETVIVGNLQSNTTYYFAVKSADEANNVSNLSNVIFTATSALSASSDDFNRAGPGLGPDWAADARVQIVNNEVQHTANLDIWSTAVYKKRRNAQEVAITYGANATTFGANFAGVLVMADSFSTMPNGYFIQHYTQAGKTRLYHVQNGQVDGAALVNEGASFGPAPQAGSEMKVVIRKESDGHYFDVYIDGQFDRTLIDLAKRENGTFSGFVMESTLFAENAITQFEAGAPPAAPKALLVVSGNNQSGRVGGKLNQPLKVQLNDAFDNPIADAEIKFTATLGAATFTKSDDHIRIEAESGVITAPLITRNDTSASGGAYLVYPNPQAAAGSTVYTFEIKKSGTYYVWTRSLTPGQTGHNSWTVSVDGAASFTYDVFQNVRSNTWAWDLLSERGSGTPDLPQFDPKTYNLAIATHTLVFEGRAHDTRLDKILITSDPNYTPQGKEEGGSITDFNGIAATEVTLGNQVGPVVVEASYAGVPAAIFNLTAKAALPYAMALASGNNQSGPAGQALALPFTVIVSDSFGNPTANADVAWVVTEGNGTLSTFRAKSDSTGKASANFTLGNDGASNKVEGRAAFTQQAVNFTATTASGIGNKLALVSGSNQTGQVGAKLVNPLAVKVSDANNANVAKFPVEFETVRGGGKTLAHNIVLNAGFEFDTNALPNDWSLDGSPTPQEVQAATQAKHSGAQSLLINSSRSNIGVTQSVPYESNVTYYLSFYAKIDSGLLRVLWRVNDVNGNFVDKIFDIGPEATGPNWQRFTLQAANGLAGKRNLYFRTNGKGTFYIDDVKIIPATDNNGQLATSWTLGDTAGAQQVQAVALGASAALTGSPIVFNAQANAGAAAKLVEASGNNQLGSAGQPLGAPFVAKVTDNFGNGVGNVSVQFQVTGGSGKLGNGAAAQTVAADVNGFARVTLTLGPNTGIDNTVSASANGLSGSPITFTAKAAIPDKMVKAAGDNQLTSAAALLATPLTVRVTDASNAPISGVAVNFSVTAGNGTINGASAAVIHTNANGEAAAPYVTGTVAGATNQVRATAEYNNQPLQGSPRNFTVNTASLKAMTLVSGNNQNGVAGDPLVNPFKVTITDTLDKPVAQQDVIFTILEGNGKLNAAVAALTVKTDSTGTASVKLTLGNLPGANNNKVQAASAAAVNGSPIIFQASARAGAPFVLKEISGDSLSGVVNNPLPAPFIVKVTDKVDNPLIDVEVIFEVTAGGGNLNGVTKDTIKTNAQGLAQVTLTAGSTSGLYNNKVQARAFNGTLELNNSPLTFVASITPSRARAMVLSAGNRQTGPAGEALANALRVRVADAQGNPIKDHAVRFRSSAATNGSFGNAATRDTTAISDVNGFAQVTWMLGSATLPDSQSVTASANDGLQDLQGSPVKFVAFATAGLPSAITSTIAGDSPVPADGQARSTITVFVKDKFGNPIMDKTVLLLASGSLNDLQQPGRTDRDGKAVGSLASTKAELKIVTAKVDNQYNLSNGAKIRFAALAAKELAYLRGNGQIGNVNTALPGQLCVMVEDQYGNGVPGFNVSFEVEAGGGRFLGQSEVVTDSVGQACVTYVLGAGAEENRVRATAPGLRNSPYIFVLNATNRPARKLIAVSGNNQVGVVLENLAKPLVMRVVDRDDRIVFGAEVTFEVTFGGGKVNSGAQAVVKSNEYGEASVTWRLGPNAGTNVARASSSGLTGSPFDFQASAQSGSPAHLVMHSGNNASGIVNQELATPLTVRVTDANNNGIDGVPVIFELLQGSGQLSNNVVNTTNGGFASTKITFGQESGARILRASAGQLQGSPQLFTVTARPANATSMQAITRTNNQNGTAGLPLNFPLQVKVSDQFGNGISNVSIDFVVKKGGGNFNGAPTASAFTNAKGIAEVRWSVQAGRNEAEAIGLGLTGSPLQFVATGVTGNNFPIFVDVPDQSVREGDRIEFILQATDADNDPIRYGAANLPPGAVFDSLGTRKFTWTTDENSAGHFEASFFVYDMRGGVDEELVIIDVANRNRAPVIISRNPVGTPGVYPDTSFAGGTITMRVRAEDPDGDVLSYRWLVNNEMTTNIASTFEFGSELKWNTVEAWVFDREDTVRTSWVIKTPVQLQSFSATLTASNHVQLDWQTSGEVDHAGFNVLRSRSRAGTYERINAELIKPARDGRYSFVDHEVEVETRYYYKLEELDVNGNARLHGPVEAVVLAPVTFNLSQNYPNPFNPATNVNYQLPRDVRVKLTIYNVLGQAVRELVNETQKAGYYSKQWDGRDETGIMLPSGIYLYRIEAGEFVSVKRMMLMK